MSPHTKKLKVWRHCPRLCQMSFGFDSANTMVVGCVLVLAIVVIVLTSLVPVI